MSDEALTASERRLRLAQEATGIGIYDFDIVTGRLDWDRHVADLWGVDHREPLTYEIFLAGLHPDDLAATDEAVQRALDPNGSGRYHAIYRVIHRVDGRTRWVEAIGHAFFEDGAPVRLIGTTQDITSRKAAEKNRELLASIVENSSDAIVGQALDGTILSWNAGAERIFGYAEAEAVGQPISLIVPEELRAIHAGELERLAKGERIAQQDTIRVAKDGRQVSVELTISPLRDEHGVVYGASKIARDVTRARRLASALQRSEESRRMAAEAAHFGTFDLDLVNREAEWSPTLRALFGLREDEPSPFDPLAAGLYPEDEMPKMRGLLATSRHPAGPGAFDAEHRILRRDGQIRWVRVRAKTLYEGEGENRRPVRTVGALHDITETKRAEEARIESEARLRRLFDQAPALISIHAGPDHICVYSNPQNDRAVGGRDMIGRPLREAVSDLVDEETFRRFDEVLETGEPIFTPVFEATFDRRGDGSLETGHFTQSLQPWFDRPGHIGGVMSFAFDVTAEVELRRQVEESEARFRSLADNIAQLAWMANAEGEIFWYNRRWYDYTGTTFEQVRGWGWREVHHPDHVERVVDYISQCFARGVRWEDTFPLRGRDGEYRWFLSRAEPIRDDAGRVTRWLGTNTDITEQRAAEERLREADERKTDFIAMLGHELRNPLAALSSAAEVLQETHTDVPGIDRISRVLSRQTRHMSRLVDGLLEVSRITRGKVELEVETVDLAKILQNLIEDRAASATARGLELTSDLTAAPAWVPGDAVRLSQIFDNLLSNALKFTRAPGHVRVSLATEDDAVTVRVRDDGDGIDPAMLEVVFEPFQQAAQGVVRESGGLGLGLAVAKGLTTLHRGTIEAHSGGEGAGTEMVVRLPRATAPEVSAARERPAADASPLRVLVVEDNRDAALMLAEVLDLRGHAAVAVHDGRAGLDRARSEPFDVVLCDIGLPGMDGFEVARGIRADARLGALRLVALTGYGQAEDVERCLAAGFDHHLTKPVKFPHLDEILRAAQTDKRTVDDAPPIRKLEP